MNWFSQHRSAIFIAGLMLSGIVLSVVGVSQHNSDKGSLLAQLCLHFSGAILAGAIATLFFSFTEVREQLSRSIASLFADAGVAELLSESARKKLQLALMLKETNGTASKLDESLAELLLSSQRDFNSVIHLASYYFQDSYTPDPTDPGLLICETVVTFRATARHLTGGKGTLPYRYFQESAIPEGITITRNNFLLDFEATFGTERFDKSSVLIRELSVEGLPTIQAIFERKVVIVGEIDCRIHYRIREKVTETSFSTFARYPAHGFGISVTYSDKFNYDCMWFKASAAAKEDFPGREEISRLNNGIMARTNGWVLPGEGVAIALTPKLVPPPKC